MRVLISNNKFNMTSSNASVENYPAWDSSANYNKDDKVIYNNHIYTSLVDSNSNNEPDSSINWFDDGATNPYKCLDSFMNTQTVADSGQNLIMEFDVTNVNGVALVNLEATKATITAYDANGNEIKSVTKDALTGVTNWGDYFFGEYEYKNKMLIEGPQLLKGSIKIEIEGSPVKVGIVLIGYLYNLGITLQGVKSSIDDYSKKETDSNGNAFLKEGNYADRFEGNVLVDINNFNKIKTRLTKLRGQPFYYTASKEDICRELDVYGFYENFEIDIDNPKKTQCNLTIRGLI